MTGHTDGARSRDAGMAAAQQHRGAGQDAAVIDRAIRHLAARGEPFTVDDIRPLLPVVDGQLLGARFMIAARRGLISRVGDAQATHAEGRARRVSVWRSTRSGSPPPAAERPSARVTTSPDQFYAPESRTAPRSATTAPAPEPPHRESSSDKARRMLAAGAVVVTYADHDGRATVQVRGDTELHTVRRVGGELVCDCTAGRLRHGIPCSHRLAAALVLAPIGQTA